jgi:hypothetical protein
MGVAASRTDISGSASSLINTFGIPSGDAAARAGHGPVIAKALNLTADEIETLS